MFFTQDFRVSLTMLSQNTFISNKGFLSILQDIAEMHSASIGLGVTDIDKTNYSWALLNWKVKIFNRPQYGDTITIRTWARHYTKLYCYRDFEVLNNKGEIIAIISSKWILIDVSKHKIAKIEDELIVQYKPELKSVFDETEIEKIIEPEESSSSINYVIRKSDIDVNGHVNNLCYVDMALEAFPGTVNEFNSCTNFEIMYKHQIKIDDNIKISYAKIDGQNYITIKNNDGTDLHSVIRFS